MSDYNPGVYAKNDDVKVADTKAQAVALVFRGYKLQEDAPVEAAVVEEPEAAKKAPKAPKSAAHTSD